MGGDFGSGVLIDGALKAARLARQDGAPLALVLVGDEARLTGELARRDLTGLSVTIRHASQVVEMEEKPTEALRRKKDSSIQVACRLVKEGLADGVVSAGNSGASLAAGMFTLGRVTGIRTAGPGLDHAHGQGAAGGAVRREANVDCKPSHLYQFGLMAEVLARDVLSMAKPRVGLLSIGEEEGKGNTLVKEAFELLRDSPVNFANVEGESRSSSKL